MDENGGWAFVAEAWARRTERTVGVFSGGIRSGSGFRDREDESL